MKYVTYIPYAIKAFFVFKNPIEFLKGQLGKRKTGTIRTYSGLNLPYWDRDDISSISVVFLKKEYGSLPKGSRLVFDVGANKGYFSMYIAQSVGRVYSFEPAPETYSKMTEVLQANPHVKNIHPYNKALAETNEDRTFYHSAENDISSSFVFKPGDSHAIQVKCITLGDVVREQNIERIDLFKIDAEGAEYGIFYNLQDDMMQRIKRIRMEYHVDAADPKANPKSLIEFLMQKGFVVKKNMAAGEGCGILWFER